MNYQIKITQNISEKLFPMFEKVIYQAIQLEYFTEKRNHENRIETIKPKSGPSKLNVSAITDHIYRNCPLLKSSLLSQVEEANTKSNSIKLAEPTMSSDLLKLLVDTRVKKLNISNGRNSDHEKIAMCVFEVLIGAHEGCGGLMNIDSGANRLILSLCVWFDELNKDKKSYLSTTNKSEGLIVHGVGTFGNFTNVKWCKKVSVDLVSILKLSEIVFFCVLGVSDKGPVQIRCKKTSQLIKREVKINDLYWITI